MLHEFLIANRSEILSRTRVRVASRIAPKPTVDDLEEGIPLFFDQLVESLSATPSGALEIRNGAATHGKHRMHMGFTVSQVVHDYGDVCQVVTQLAIELKAPISTEEFQKLNRHLDDAIADAVTEHARARELSILDGETERLACFGHELRNLLHAASLAYQVLRGGTVAIGGSTGAVLGRSLTGLRQLVDRALAEVRLNAGDHYHERVDVSAFLGEIGVSDTLEARARGVTLLADPGAGGVEVNADRQLLGSAVANLLQNAFKFTREHGTVWLRTSATADRVSIEIEDECGGLPPAIEEQLFGPTRPQGRDKTGLGLGLMISKRAIEAIGGELRARNHPGTGCVFTVDLPRLKPCQLEHVPSKAPEQLIRELDAPVPAIEIRAIC
jgi:signal transduction histidine kinase